MEQMDNSKELFGIQVDFNNHVGKLMSKELMNFSQQRSMMQEHLSNPAMCHQPTHQAHIQWKERGAALSFFFSNFEKNCIKCCKASRAKIHACAQALDKFFLKWL
jgi:hypothetical protein